MSLLASQRDLFDIPPDVAYLNCAYMSPLMHSVVKAGDAAVRCKQQPWRITAPDFFDLPDRGCELFARIIAAHRDDVAVIPSASYGLTIAALNCKVDAGQQILLLADQFPSNVYPWRKKAADSGGSIVTVPRPEEGAPWTPAIIDAIGADTAVVALPHCHWTDGSLIDLLAVGQAARAAGAALVIDATQSIGSLPFDVRDVRPDYLVAATYKWLLGPYSLGFLYVARHRQTDQPLEQTWAGRMGSENFARLVDYQEEYAPGMKRMDMGEASQFHLMPMAIAAMEQMKFLPENLRASHFLGLKFPGGVPDHLLERLVERGVYVSVRGNSMRITPHLYNDDDDVDRLIDALSSVI
jgi:selenocysteine lyase/cysteine desulfurase